MGWIGESVQRVLSLSVLYAAMGTPSSSPICRSESGDSLYRMALVREMTPRPSKAASRLIISYVMPSAKYSSSGAPRFSNGSTAIIFRSETASREARVAAMSSSDGTRPCQKR